MSSLRARQKELMNHLLGKESNIEDHVVEQGNVSKHTRLAIYKNAYNVRLKETIETDHEVLGLYLGDELFDAMAAEYILLCPSHNHSLRQYADKLPNFLSNQYPPFAELPLIGELARFERLLLSAFDAAETARMSMADLQSLPAEKWPEMHFHFHPSMQLFTCDWNVVETWQAIKEKRTPPQPVQQPQHWLLWRNNDRLTEFRSVNDVEFSLLTDALTGNNFSQLCEKLLQYHSEEESGQVAVNYLINWITHGLLC